MLEPIGIGDDPFKIDDDSYDYYPLMDYQVIPEFDDAVVPVIVVVIVFGLLHARKKREDP